ncbi:hypothetical protein [Ensifer sp. BR816]|uniref:hypothetical protein n=1 Tax=Rhizobium sp. (strain BR816) TaxID=1057002 RepID=UPI0003682A02|nr:hypothetical protein [Ensifer sp. BR816]
MTAASQYIPPDDVEMLSVVFGELLRDCHSRRDSPEAEDLAARLVAIYQSGVRDTMLLRKLTIPFLRQG